MKIEHKHGCTDVKMADIPVGTTCTGKIHGGGMRVLFKAHHAIVDLETGAVWSQKHSSMLDVKEYRIVKATLVLG